MPRRTLALALAAASLLSGGAFAKPPKPVAVTNFPATQQVSGTVSVSNLPATQPVTGAVSVLNLPAVQPVNGTVSVSNLPTLQSVSGTVSVGNLPAVQDVNVVGGCSAGGWLAGFTAAAFDGGSGFLAFAAACNSEFPGTRVCSSLDIVRTTAVPPGLTGGAWVAPMLVANGNAFDAGSGKHSNNPADFTCQGWNGGSNSGLAVDASGRFFLASCSQSYSAACCTAP